MLKLKSGSDCLPACLAASQPISPGRETLIKVKLDLLGPVWVE
jgi:hypothetical protein